MSSDLTGKIARDNARMQLAALERLTMDQALSALHDGDVDEAVRILNVNAPKVVRLRKNIDGQADSVAT